MKVRDTSRGRMYAVASNPGCTVINGDMAVDVPAGGQSVILALDKKLIIDGDDDAKFVEVRWGTNAAIGSRPINWMGDVVDGLVSIVGADNFDLNYIPTENKLYLVFSLDTTNEQLEEVESLLESVLPGNVVTEMEWADGLPMTYTRLEFLESTRVQYIQTSIKLNPNSDIYCDVYLTNGPSSNIFGYREPLDGLTNAGVYVVPLSAGYFVNWRYNQRVTAGAWTNNTRYAIEQTNTQLTINGKKVASYKAPDDWSTSYTCRVFGSTNVPGASANFIGRFYSFTVKEWGADVISLIPTLDPTGAPCMFDTVTRKPFYNSGTGDFLYPGAEQAVQTLDLDWDAKFYAKRTEHGVRRLYHVPKGYNGTKDQYAAEHGFKELVEPPMPLEGYWTPEWRETDTQLILEWVETEEPPTEEEIENA